MGMKRLPTCVPTYPCWSDEQSACVNLNGKTAGLVFREQNEKYTRPTIIRCMKDMGTEVCEDVTRGAEKMAENAVNQGLIRAGIPDGVPGLQRTVVKAVDTVDQANLTVRSVNDSLQSGLFLRLNYTQIVKGVVALFAIITLGYGAALIYWAYQERKRQENESKK